MLLRLLIILPVVAGSLGCLAPITDRLDALTAQIQHVNTQLAETNRQLERANAQLEKVETGVRRMSSDEAAAAGASAR